MRIHRRIAIATTLLLATPASYAHTPSVEVTRYRLASGLEVLLAPETDSPRVVVEICYRGERRSP
jgi:hypothetical protein